MAIKMKKKCPECGKKLVYKPCLACGGKGATGSWLVRQTCQTCGGKGRILRCPDEFKHRSSLLRSHTRQGGLRASQSATCPRCGGQLNVASCKACGGRGRWSETIPGQWSKKELRKNPFLPYYDSPSPRTVFRVCSICNGKGKMLFCPTCN